MRIAAALTLALALALACGTVRARGEVPPARQELLRRGVNLTNWFRFPPRQDAAAVRDYLSDAALRDLRAAGFTFVRLPVQPEFVFGAAERLGLLAAAVGRVQRHGLAVVVELHPTSWHLESPPDRARLLAAWRVLAAALGGLDPAMTFPEIVNEPVFAGDSAGWEALQAEALAVIRTALPASTVVLTGNDWGSLDGLLRLHPVADRNVVYSVHFYEPSVLTTLAGFRPGLDRAALAGLPFPAVPGCGGGAAPEYRVAGETGAVMRYYCAGGWDAAKLRERIALVAAWARRHRATVLAGEFGADVRLNPAARLAWLAAVRQGFAEQGMGWALWGYDDVMGFDVRRPPPPRPRLAPDLLRALGLRDPGALGLPDSAGAPPR